MQLKELLDGVDVLALRGDPSVEVGALTHDSRRVQPGTCFACVPGSGTDGHAHAPDAVAAGAVALLVERELDLGVAEAEVGSVRIALGPAAARLHGFPSRLMRCLGVTGTNGKTTTTYLLESIARSAGERVGLVGTTGARIAGRVVPLAHTTPEATELQDLLAQMVTAGVGTVAMEVSSHSLEQHRIDGTWFAAVGFTNLTHEHLDYHGTLEAYFEAKAKLFDKERTAAAAINIDDPHGRALVQRTLGAGLPTITFGLDADGADVGAHAVEPSDDEKVRFVLVDRRGGVDATIELSLLGRFNVANALTAAAVALAGGLDFASVVSGLSSDVVVPGRFEVISEGQPFRVVVDYAHTPDALATAIGAGRALAVSHRVIVVFGCGGDRDRDKRPLMGNAAGDADLAVLTSDNPRGEDPADIAEEVLVGMRGAHAETKVELDRSAAIELALRAATSGDVVIIAGKGHEAEQTAAGVARPFDDRAVARKLLGAMSWS